MKAVGLGFLLFGALAFLFPYYDRFVSVIDMTGDESRLVGGLCVAVGALTLAVFRQRE